MNEFFQQLKKEAQGTRLTHDEKQRMRVALYERMKKTPAPVAREAVARPTPSPYVWFAPRYALPVAVLLVGVLGTSTAYASQAALPGDALYTIKVNVTEPALGALALSNEAKAHWHVSVAQTRLEEAETLAAAGRLDATAVAQISENFDEHSSEAQVFAQKVEDDEPGSGEDIAAQFDSSLAAHDAILSRLSGEEGSSKQFAEDVATHVRERQTTLALASYGTEVSGASAKKGADTEALFATSVAPEAAPSLSTESAPLQEETSAPKTMAQLKAAAKLKKSAASVLSDAQDTFDATNKSLDASTTLKIEGELARLGAVINAATSTASLTGALKDATVLKAFLKASKKFNRNLFTNDKSKEDSQKQEDRGTNKSGSKNKNQTGSASEVRSTPSINATTQVEVQVTQPENSSGNDSGSDKRGSSGSDDQNKSDDDSFVRSLLTNF